MNVLIFNSIHNLAVFYYLDRCGTPYGPYVFIKLLLAANSFEAFLLLYDYFIIA